MNRILKCTVAMLLCVCTVFSLIPASALAANGDVTADSNTNMMDVMALYGHLAGTKPLADTKNADVNSDGSVNMNDVMALYNKLSGASSDTVKPVTIRSGVTDESVYMDKIVVKNTYTGRTFTAKTKADLQMAVAEIVRYEVGMSTFGEKNDEAWKAMAVAAYTVLARHCYNGSSYNIYMTKDIDLNNTTDKRIYDAVGKVLGIKIAYNDASRSPLNQLCEVFYSASSAGVTCTTLNAWGYSDLEYLPQVKSPYDTDEWIKHYSANTDSLTHSFSITMTELLACVARLKGVDTASYDTKAGEFSLYATDKTGPYWGTTNVYYINSSGKKTYVRGVDIYTAINYYGKPHCYSHAITVKSESNGTLTIETKGNGHGIGLSQYGVAGLANDAGWTYDRIIAHYYAITDDTKWGLVGPKW